MIRTWVALTFAAVLLWAPPSLACPWGAFGCVTSGSHPSPGGMVSEEPSRLDWGAIVWGQDEWSG